MKQTRKRSVRVLVWRQHGNDDPRYYATTSGSVETSSRDLFRKHIIGFAEFPSNTVVEAQSGYEDFKTEVEEKAEYVHWKPRWKNALQEDRGDVS